MVFTGTELLEVLRRSGDGIEQRNEYGRHVRTLSRDRALELDPDLCVGIGNRRRVRFIRPRTSKTLLNAGSQTTQRMNDGFGRNIAAPFIREHRATGEAL